MIYLENSIVFETMMLKNAVYVLKMLRNAVYVGNCSFDVFMRDAAS